MNEVYAAWARADKNGFSLFDDHAGAGTLNVNVKQLSGNGLVLIDTSHSARANT